MNHPSGITSGEIAEHMTFNLGTAFEYLWHTGDDKDGLESALRYVRRSDEHDTHYLTGHSTACFAFREFMATRRIIFNRPSPWCEPVRHALALICDIHSGRGIRSRAEINLSIIRCIETAISDCECIGQGQKA